MEKTDLTSTIETDKTAVEETEKTEEAKTAWEKPRLEDVSGKIMAQPYIRFT